MSPKPALQMKLAPERRLIMTFALRQALEVLQMPQLELALWLRGEIEQNPLLELDPKGPSSSKFRFEEGFQIASPPSLHEHLMRQVRDCFSSEAERSTAKKILCHLDEKGFLDPTYLQACEPNLSSFEKILSVMQTFDPPGICARNLQESLLLQLRAMGKEGSEAFKIVLKNFEDLLHCRFGKIKKKLEISDLSESLKTLSRLCLRPLEQLRLEPAPSVLPDIQIQKNRDRWIIELDESELPQFQIRTDYLSLIPESPEEKEALRLFKASAKWLIRSLSRRKSLLYQIAQLIAKKQEAFLEDKGPLAALSLKDLSESLQIHESTLSRALAGKQADTPRGLIPLRSLITSFPKTDTAKTLLEKIIGGEDKRTPLTDDQLAQAVRGSGFNIARRTVAKYRKQLKIGPAIQRKTFCPKEKKRSFFAM